MSKIVCEIGIKGAYLIFEKALEEYEEAVKVFGKEKAVGFPNTAYFFPIIYALLGYPVKRLGDCGEVLEEIKKLLPKDSSSDFFFWGKALDAGIVALFAEEIIEAIRYLKQPDFYCLSEDPEEGKLWLGAAKTGAEKEGISSLNRRTAWGGGHL